MANPPRQRKSVNSSQFYLRLHHTGLRKLSQTPPNRLQAQLALTSPCLWSQKLVYLEMSHATLHHIGTVQGVTVIEGYGRHGPLLSLIDGDETYTEDTEAWSNQQAGISSWTQHRGSDEPGRWCACKCVLASDWHG